LSYDAFYQKHVLKIKNLANHVFFFLPRTKFELSIFKMYFLPC
jgi:hypothetical protein